MILMRHRTLSILALALLAGACETTTEVPWEIRSADPAALEGAAIVETSVRRGGCEGVLVYREPIGAGRPGPRPQLGRGLHGFAAEVRDASCVPLARGCIERDLPLRPGERVELVLERVLPTPACAPSACVEGTCTDVDAGTVELDAGVPPRPDASMPGERDAGTRPPEEDAGTVAPEEDAGTAAPEEDASVPDEPDAGAPGEPDAGGPTSSCDGTEWSGRCYVFRSEARDWSTAETSCVAWGGHLASLGGPDEESFVRGLAGGTSYWIGLNDLTITDIFGWVDGSTASYRRWAAGEPSGNPQAHCVRDDPATGWLLRRCRDVHAYVCER